MLDQRMDTHENDWFSPPKIDTAPLYEDQTQSTYETNWTMERTCSLKPIMRSWLINSGDTTSAFNWKGEIKSENDPWGIRVVGWRDDGHHCTFSHPRITVGWNYLKSTRSFHREKPLPKSLGVSELANEWAQRSVRAKQAERSKQLSERYEQRNERMSKWPAQYLRPDSRALGCSKPRW